MISRLQAGAALVIVIWALAIISAVVAAYFTRGMLEVYYTLEQRSETEARALAQAGVTSCLQLFMADEDEVDIPGEDWFLADEDALTSVSGDGTISVRVFDYGSRINLNLTGQPSLMLLFKDNAAAADALLDWLDEDNQARAKGAEDEYYLSLDPPLTPANGPFLCPEEVFLVKGIEDVRRIVENDTTVYGKANPNLITPQVWATILRLAGIDPGLHEVLTEQFTDARQKADRDGIVLFHALEDLGQKIGRMTENEWKPLAPYLTFSGQINPNFASERVLRVALDLLGLNPDKARAILELKQQNGPFKDLDGIHNLLDTDDEKLGVSMERLQQVFTLQTTMIGIDVVGYTKDRDLHRIAAVVERYHPRMESTRWRCRILYWREWPGQEFPLRPE
ncbi:MAG: general secretion pathway protein GspK [Bacteroidota bacterium]